MFTESTYWLVFISGLISSTILPGNSEAVFSLALLDHPQQLLPLLMWVTAGNTIGGMISWGMGRAIAIRYPAERLSNPGRTRALKTIQNWGSPALLLSWVPVIGDPLCVAAGWLKTPAALSLFFIMTGKFFRYLLLAWIIS